MSEQPLRLLTHDIPGEFFARVGAILPDVRRLTIVSPWISLGAGERRSLMSILEALPVAAELILMTRRPSVRDTWHLSAVTTIRKRPRTRVYYHPTLHAKIFLCEGATRQFGIFGSANATAAGSQGREIGCHVSNRGIGARIFFDLVVFSQQLRHDVGVSRTRPEVGE